MSSTTARCADTTTTSSTWSAGWSERVDRVDQRRLAWAAHLQHEDAAGAEHALGCRQTRAHPVETVLTAVDRVARVVRVACRSRRAGT